MSAEEPTSLAYRVFKRILFAILILFVFVLLLGAGGMNAFILQIPFHIFFGWVFHGWKELPALLGNWREAVLPLGCLFLATLLLNRFIIRWAEKKRPSLYWRMRHTVAILSVLFLCSAATIATSGVVHQLVWLGKGKVIENNRRIHLTLAASNGRQLMLALSDYEEENGRYPRSFGELEAEAGDNSEIIRQLAWLDFRDGKVPEPWILLRPGSSETALANEPVIVSPVIPGDRMAVVGYGDLTVRRIRVEELQEVLGQVEDGKEGR